MSTYIERLLQRPRKEGIKELSSILHSKLDKQLETVGMSNEKAGVYWCSLADELLNIAAAPYAKKNAWKAFAVAQEEVVDLPHCVQAGARWLQANKEHTPAPILKTLSPPWRVFTGSLENITPTDMTLLVAASRLPETEAMTYIEKWLSKLQQKTSLNRLPMYVMQYDSGPDNSDLWEYVVQPYLEHILNEVNPVNMPYLPLYFHLGVCDKLDAKLSPAAKVWMYLNITCKEPMLSIERDDMNDWIDEKTKALPQGSTEHLVAVLNLIQREPTKENGLLRLKKHLPHIAQTLEALDMYDLSAQKDALRTLIKTGSFAPSALPLPELDLTQ